MLDFFFIKTKSNMTDIITDIINIFKEEVNSVQSFSSILAEIVKFSNSNQKKEGLMFPSYCDFAIERNVDETYSLLIRAYYSTEEDNKFLEKKRKIIYSEIVNIPPEFAKILEEKGKIQVEISDLESLLNESSNKIKNPIQYSEIIQAFNRFIKLESTTPNAILLKELIIEDKLFFNKVRLHYKYKLGKKILEKSAVLRTAYITSLPNEVKKEIQESGKSVIVIN